MLEFVEALEKELTDSLTAFSLEPNKLGGAYKSLEAVQNAIILLQQYVRDNPFADLADEIHYYRRIAPVFYSRFHYYSKIRRLELDKKYAGRMQMELQLIYEQNIIAGFYNRHSDFRGFYFDANSEIDDRMFIRDEKENRWQDELEEIMANDFSLGCFLASKMLGNESLREYVSVELELLQNPQFKNADQKPVLVWTDSVPALVEMIYGHWLMRSFNDGNATLKEIAAWCEANLGVSLRNYHVRWQEITQRKKNPTPHVDEMKEKLVKYMEEEG